MTHLLIEPAQQGREDLAAYQARGGYRGLTAARARGSGWILEQVAQAGLRGRGGSGDGRPIGQTWGRVAAAAARERVVVANGAESQAVSQKDRHLLARFPHRVLEGLLLAAHALGAREAYFYVRGDSPEALSAAQEAVACWPAQPACWPG